MAAGGSSHLSFVKSDFYERQWERFQVKRPARITAVDVGLRKTFTRGCHVVDISRGGAGLVMDGLHGLPPHYYLNIIGLSNRIGCAEVYRQGERVGVKFIQPISELLLSEIIHTDFRNAADKYRN
jgi:hypothetical protein